MGGGLAKTSRQDIHEESLEPIQEKYMATEIGTKGTVVQVLGAVVDVEFPQDKLPEIYNAVLTRPSGADQDLTLEVEQHLGNNWVRCVAMGPTDGLQRGVEAIDTCKAIAVPVGQE